MKVLFLVSCALAAASASWSHSPVYHGPQHIPVIHKGVPVDTPEVQHAREAHLAALAKASVHSYEHNYDEQSYDNLYDNHDNHYDSHANDYDNDANQYDNHYNTHDDHNDNHVNTYGYSIKHVSYPIAYDNHDDQHHSSPAYPKLAYAISYEHAKIGHDGKPVETPEVESAKAHHFAAVHKALALTASHGVHYRKRRSLYTAYPQHIPVISHEGVPVEPLEVQHARAEHLAAHNFAAYSKSYGYSTHQVHAPVYGHHYDYFIPKYDHEGHPLDTDEVEHAKAAHFAAYHKIGAAVPLGYHYGSYGVPVDTIEVQHAKAAHLAAHAAAKAYHY